MNILSQHHKSDNDSYVILPNNLNDIYVNYMIFESAYL